MKIHKKYNGIEIANNLKILRNSLNLSQSEFAKKINVTRAVISNLEQGRNKHLNIVLLKLICNEFNVNEEWLFNGKGKMYNTNDSTLKKIKSDYNLSNNEFIILETYLNLNVNERKTVENFIMQLTKKLHNQINELNNNNTVNKNDKVILQIAGFDGSTEIEINPTEILKDIENYIPLNSDDEL